MYNALDLKSPAISAEDGLKRALSRDEAFFAKRYHAYKRMQFLLSCALPLILLAMYGALLCAPLWLGLSAYPFAKPVALLSMTLVFLATVIGLQDARTFMEFNHWCVPLSEGYLSSWNFQRLMESARLKNVSDTIQSTRPLYWTDYWLLEGIAKHEISEGRCTSDRGGAILDVLGHAEPD